MGSGGVPLPEDLVSGSEGLEYSVGRAGEGGSMWVSSARRAHFGSRPNVLAVLAFSGNACCFSKFVIFFVGHICTEQKVSKVVLKTTNIQKKKNTMLCSIRYDFSRVLKTWRLRARAYSAFARTRWRSSPPY